MINVFRRKMLIFGFLQISAAQLLRNIKIPSLEVKEILKKEKSRLKERNCSFHTKISDVNQI